MESLYTKYRPQTFADVVGQTHVVTTLEHAVLEGRTSHAYLFCGPRGTGKTTMARLLAKALMCERGAGHLPDGTCEQCRAIAAGEHPDVYELDAASRTGVDNVREEIISRVNFAPSRAPYKMYIIDEVHMLTVAAFNALLKTLEEPPSHVVFVLCTTDPQKIPETILSRVQRFDFHAIGNADIQARLAYICEREGFSYDPEALELVVRHARGGMRDAISELEQLSVSGGGSITVDVARDVLGEVSASTLQQMSLAMAQRDVPKLFAQVEALVEVGRDLLQFTRALAARLRDVYVVAAIGERSGTVMAPDDELPAIAREAREFGSVDRVSRALQILSDASTEMRVAPNQRLVLEVALTKVARPQSELTLEALADRVASLERQLVALSTPSARRERATAAEGTPASRPAKAAAEPSSPSGPAREAPTAALRVAQAGPAPASAPTPAPAAAPASAQDYSPASAPASTPSASRQDAPTPRAARQPSPAPAPSAPAGREPSQAAAPSAAAGAPASAQVPAQAPSHVPAPTQAVVDQGELQRRWKQVVDNLRAAAPQHGSLLMNSTIVADDGHQLVVSFPKGSSFACRMLERKDVRANVDPVIASVFGPRKAFFAEDAAARAAAAGMSGAATAVTQAEPAAAPAQPARTTAAAQTPSSQTSHPAPEPTAQPQSQPPVTPQVAQPASPWQEAPRSAAQASAQPAPRTAPQPVSHTVPQPASHAAPQSAQPAAQRPAAQQPAAQQPAAPQPAVQQPVYVAPWEAEPSYADDVVPYDDFDAAPYEEDYLFGQPAMPAAPKAPQATDNRRPPVAPPVPVPVPVPVSADTIRRKDAPRRSAAPDPALIVSGPAAPSPAAAPAPAVAAASAPTSVAPSGPAGPQLSAPRHQTPAAPSFPGADAAPAPVAETAAPSSDSAPAMPSPAASEPVSAPELPQGQAAMSAPEPEAEPAEAPAPKRAPRRTGGIPANIIKMMDDLFGEGTNFSVVPPEEEDTTIEEESELEDGYDAESEFVQEAVDDADYDEED